MVSDNDLWALRSIRPLPRSFLLHSEQQNHENSDRQNARNDADQRNVVQVVLPTAKLNTDKSCHTKHAVKAAAGNTPPLTIVS